MRISDWSSDVCSSDLAYHALRSVLHALRDRLTLEEAAHLGAQLPMLVRGIYYDSWHPAGMPRRERSEGEFLAHVEKGLRNIRPMNPGEAVQSVFKEIGRAHVCTPVTNAHLV